MRNLPVEQISESQRLAPKLHVLHCNHLARSMPICAILLFGKRYLTKMCLHVRFSFRFSVSCLFPVNEHARVCSPGDPSSLVLNQRWPASEKMASSQSKARW